jgi:uncharacterized Zn finger protein (UPF0148 family)
MSNRMIVKYSITVFCPHCGHWIEESKDYKNKIKQMKIEMRKHIKECNKTTYESLEK